MKNMNIELTNIKFSTCGKKHRIRLELGWKKVVRAVGLLGGVEGVGGRHSEGRRAKEVFVFSQADALPGGLGQSGGGRSLLLARPLKRRQVEHVGGRAVVVEPVGRLSLVLQQHRFPLLLQVQLVIRQQRFVPVGVTNKGVLA